MAQRKRVWLITRRTVDRNNPMIFRKMNTVKAVTDMCDGKQLFALETVAYAWGHISNRVVVA